MNDLFFSIFQTAVTSLLSALCCVTVAVLSSPVVMKMISTSFFIYPQTMYFAIGLSVVTFVHVVACLIFPTSSRSSPDFVKFSNLLVSSISSLGNEQLLSLALLQKRGKRLMIFNFISAVSNLKFSSIDGHCGLLNFWDLGVGD